MKSEQITNFIFKVFAVIGLLSTVAFAGAAAGYWWAKFGEVQFVAAKAKCGSCRYEIKEPGK